MENARAEIMTRKRGEGSVKENGENEEGDLKRGWWRESGESSGGGRARQNGVRHPILPENAKRERRAPHFIAAASSLFIADTTLRHISLRIPRGIPRYVRWQREREKEPRRRRGWAANGVVRGTTGRRAMVDSSGMPRAFQDNCRS